MLHNPGPFIEEYVGMVDSYMRLVLTMRATKKWRDGYERRNRDLHLLRTIENVLKSLYNGKVLNVGHKFPREA